MPLPEQPTNLSDVGAAAADTAASQAVSMGAAAADKLAATASAIDTADEIGGMLPKIKAAQNAWGQGSHFYKSQGMGFLKPSVVGRHAGSLSGRFKLAIMEGAGMPGSKMRVRPGDMGQYAQQLRQVLQRKAAAGVQSKTLQSVLSNPAARGLTRVGSRALWLLNLALSFKDAAKGYADPENAEEHAMDLMTMTAPGPSVGGVARYATDTADAVRHTPMSVLRATSAGKEILSTLVQALWQGGPKEQVGQVWDVPPDIKPRT